MEQRDAAGLQRGTYGVRKKAIQCAMTRWMGRWKGGFFCAWRLDHRSGWIGGEGAQSESAAVPGVKAWRACPLTGKKSKDALGLVCQEGK